MGETVAEYVLTSTTLMSTHTLQVTLTGMTNNCEVFVINYKQNIDKNNIYYNANEY